MHNLIGSLNVYIIMNPVSWRVRYPGMPQFDPEFMKTFEKNQKEMHRRISLSLK